MRKNHIWLWVLGAAVAACAPSPEVSQPEPDSTPTDTPVRIILFIGDGAGTSYWTAAHFAADALAVHQFPVVGLVDVRSSSSDITDSAASATSYASGIVTFNGAISVDTATVPVKTVLEIAAERGMGTGLVATSSVTHATPAAFAAHVPNRGLQFEIARQMVAQNVSVVLAGGRRYFHPTYRPDSLDLLQSIRQNHVYVSSATDFRRLGLDTIPALFGLFAHNHMLPSTARHPTLAEMTEAALTVLDQNPSGFFLMIEGSQPDWRGHENASLDAITAEMLDLDRAIGAALKYRNEHPETLIVVTADHETGGLALQFDSTTSLVAAYTSGGHTASMVPLFAIGPGAERFGGITTNDRVGRLLVESVTR